MRRPGCARSDWIVAWPGAVPGTAGRRLYPEQTSATAGIAAMAFALDQLGGWGAALGAGLLIGLERQRDQPPDEAQPGMRSFALAALAGALAQSFGDAADDHDLHGLTFERVRLHRASARGARLDFAQTY